MTSAIDASKPVSGNPTTQSVRDNFATAKSEISALQTVTAGGPYLPLGGTLTANFACNDITVGGNGGFAGNLTLSGNLGANHGTFGGNVGIGTTTPRAMLDVNGIAAMSNNLYVQNAANGAVGLVPGDIGNTGYVEWLLPSASLGGGTRVAYMGYNLAGRISLTLAAATSFIVGNASSDFLAVAASGNVGIGTISPGSLLTVNGTCANVSGAWTTISDASVKENVQPYTRGLDAIAALKPVEFCYAAGTPFAEADKPSRQLFGLIADEVKPHVPEIVGTTTATVGKKEGVELSTLEPGNLIYALINSCKELAAKNSALETRIAALESATVH